MDYQKLRQAKAIESKNKKRMLEANNTLNDDSGIYFLTREELEMKFAYVGQAKHILTRLAQHLVGYQHIDLSLKRHGLYSEDNPCGWRVGFMNFPESQLDEKEQYYITLYAQHGYQLRNKTAGGQGAGKKQIDEYRPAKGYRDGLKQGYVNASREISNLFEKHLDFTTKNTIPNKNQLRAVEKFNDFLNVCKRGKEDG